MESSYTDRIIISAAKRAHLDRLALRALMKANQLLGLALGVRLAKIRDSDEPLQTLLKIGPDFMLLVMPTSFQPPNTQSA